MLEAGRVEVLLLFYYSSYFCSFLILCSLYLIKFSPLLYCYFGDSDHCFISCVLDYAPSILFGRNLFLGDSTPYVPGIGKSPPEVEAPGAKIQDPCP